MGKKKPSAPIVCEVHPEDALNKCSVNLDICGVCGAHIHHNRQAEYQLSERVTLNPGDLIKVKGMRGTHKYEEVLLDQPGYPERDLPAGDYVIFTMLDAGREWKQGNTAHASRVTRASRKKEAR